MGLRKRRRWKYSFTKSILVGCVLLASVTITRCQYSLVYPPPALGIPTPWYTFLPDITLVYTPALVYTLPLAHLPPSTRDTHTPRRDLGQYTHPSTHPRGQTVTSENGVTPQLPLQAIKNNDQQNVNFIRKMFSEAVCERRRPSVYQIPAEKPMCAGYPRSAVVNVDECWNCSMTIVHKQTTRIINDCSPG